MKKDERYNIVLDCATIIFDIAVPEEVANRIVEEINEKVDGVEVGGLYRGEIEVVTKFGDERHFWDRRIPAIDSIVKKHLNAL